VADLARDERLMPSVYLARGERLRIQAHTGYRQVLDGFLPTTGVIGETFRTGRAHRVEDIAADEHYLAAALGVVAEYSLPLRHDGIVIGVLNVESRERLAPEQIEQIEAAAAALEGRIAEVGGPPPESAAQRLARAAAHLTTLSEPAAIASATLDAARDLTSMDSAWLVAPNARVAAGPLGAALLVAPATVAEGLAETTVNGSSFYTVAAWGEEFEALAALYDLGARAVAGARVARRDGRHGVLIAADTAREAVTTEQIELLELLAAHAGSALQTADDLAELRRRATTDSLTGLGHHASFNERLTEARAAEATTAVLIVDVDGFKTINDTSGHQAGDQALRTVAARLSSAVRRGDEVFRIGGDEFAALVRVADADEATGIGHRLRDALVGTGLTVSVGVAVPQAGESDAAVLARADRALYAVKSSGRDGVLLAA
jgi:diguanylate cyclase (GGDEF)-like protein